MIYSQNIDDFVSAMIAGGWYRYKPLKGEPVIFDGEIFYSYIGFVKDFQFIVGETKYGTPKYLDLHTIDRDREDFPVLRKLFCDPKRPFGKILGEPAFNTAKPLNPKFPIKGNNNNLDVSIFWNHLEYLCGDVKPDDKEWVKDWLADLFQNPNNKKGTSLVFIGGQGCGKSIFFDELMAALLGEYHHHSDEKTFGEKFNLELKDKLLINFDEGFAGKSKLAEAKLKSFITQATFKIQGKGTNAFNVLNPARAVFTTNSYHAINTEDDDRRFAVFKTIKKDFATPEYFDDFTQAIENTALLEQFMYELQTRRIKSRLSVPPVTDEKKNQKAFSADKVSEWFNYIITTPKNYEVPLKDVPQNGYNFRGRLWNFSEQNERRMFKDNGLESFLNFRGNNQNIDTTNKLFSALKSHLDGNSEWSVSNEPCRVIPDGLGLQKNETQRLWVFKKKELPKSEQSSQ